MGGLLEGTVALVTGGASGIGRSVCLRFAEQGARAVVVADTRDSPRGAGKPTHVLVEELGARSAYLHADTTNSADLAAAVQVAEDMGGLDVMVNNAGVALAEDIFEMSEIDYDHIMGVNMKGVFLGSQAAARVMRGRGGTIINMSSVGGIRSSAAIPVYAASKAAVRLFTLALANKLGPLGIRVIALAPGLIDTEMNRADTKILDSSGQAQQRAGAIPLRRIGQPRDVADAAVFLASPLAGYVTGTSLVVDGGMLSC